MLLNISQIDVGDRLREDPGDDFDDLVESIKRLGQLQPILVEDRGDGSFKLVAGERRLRAITLLNGRGDAIPRLSPGCIYAETMEQLSPELSLTLEFEENVRRRDFTFQEKAKYVRRFHEAFRKSTDGNWTGEMTAYALKLAPSSISQYLELDKMIEAHPDIAKAKTLRGAFKRVKTIKQHEHRMEEAKLKNDDEGTKKAHECLALGDGLQWLKNIPSDSIDLVNLDPPWGENASYKTWQAWETFDDTTESASELIPLLLAEAYRILKPDRFCIYWYRTWAYNDMVSLSLSTGFSLKHSMTPCIWYKPDKVSDKMAFPEKQLITSYETFLLLRKGDPVFYEKEVQNVFVEPRVPVGDLIHPTEKPLSLMDRLVRLCSVPGETVADPTAGSASFLAAAYKAFRKPSGCELERSFYERALIRLAEVMK